jgi:hypothetical protein
MDPLDCRLRAENCAAAARLDNSGQAYELLKLSAYWRTRDIVERCRRAGLDIETRNRPDPLRPM